MGLTFKKSISNEINPWKNKARTNDFFSHNHFIVWESNKVSWEYINICFGIRRSDMWQIFPIWKDSHNCRKGVMFGFWKFYFSIVYNF
jgi:hypothetical protein